MTLIDIVGREERKKGGLSIRISSCCSLFSELCMYVWMVRSLRWMDGWMDVALFVTVGSR